MYGYMDAIYTYVGCSTIKLCVIHRSTQSALSHIYRHSKKNRSYVVGHISRFTIAYVRMYVCILCVLPGALPGQFNYVSRASQRAR